MAKTCDLHKSKEVHDKGVHLSLASTAARGSVNSKNKELQGMSSMGYNVRNPRKGMVSPKDKASQSLKQLQGMPKPNLGKAEHSPTCKKSFVKSEEGKHDPCPYCADSEDNRTDDCAYCQDLDAEENADGTAGMDDCPACQEYDSANQETGMVNDGCPYCESETLGEAAAGSAPNDVGSEHPNDCPECQKMYSEAAENEAGQTGQGDPNLQGHETAEEVLGLLDQEPGSSPDPAQEAQKIDDTELPQGDAMKDGTSVTEDFGQAQKNDVPDSDAALAQDQPDMTNVLQSGLDDHANEQKKQQVLDMVGQTLAGFKANKASLEATKEQNQPLYNSCIQMLKSMISLCDLLGLKPQTPQDPGAVAEATQSGAPNGPKATAPAEGSPDPKAVA